MRFLVVAGLGVLMGLVQTARAEPVGLGVAARVRPIFTVEGQAGLGSPLGVVGAAASLAVLPWVDLAIGAGLAADGPQVAGTLRVHQRKSGWRMFGAASVSQGDWIDGGINKTRHLFDGARWVSAELGAENGQRGVFTRWGVGFTKLVSYDACHDEDYPGDPAARVNPCRDPLQRSYLLPFLSITLGYRY